MSGVAIQNGKPAKRPYKGRKNGRKTKFGKADPTKLAALAFKHGATEVELAKALGVTTQSLRNWKRAKKGFLCALSKARTEKDQVVEEALFHRAKGYSHPSVKIMVVDGKVRRERFTEHYPPDTGAAQFWLTNRAADKWKSRNETSLSNPDGTNLQGGTTVVAPTVVFVQPAKQPLAQEPALLNEANGGNGHA